MIEATLATQCSGISEHRRSISNHVFVKFVYCVLVIAPYACKWRKKCALPIAYPFRFVYLRSTFSLSLVFVCGWLACVRELCCCSSCQCRFFLHTYQHSQAMFVTEGPGTYQNFEHIQNLSKPLRAHNIHHFGKNKLHHTFALLLHHFGSTNTF